MYPDSLYVVVRPSAPEPVVVDQISSRAARVSWTLTHTTPDQSADQLIVRLTFTNRSLADHIFLPGASSSTSLEGLVPATGYSLVLTAINRDGEVTTNPVTFRTLEGPPAVSRVDVQRLNATGFSVSIELMYTGGGNITELVVSYRALADPSNVGHLGKFIPQSNGLLVTATIDLAHSVDEATAAGELEFTVMVYNQFDFHSPPHTHQGMREGAWCGIGVSSILFLCQ